LEDFLNSKNIRYDKCSIDKLRKLHQLRNTKSPIHTSEQDAIRILNDFGIVYPVHDWLEAGKICLREFVSSICKLITKLS
jgi:hypothetical protein